MSRLLLLCALLSVASAIVEDEALFMYGEGVDDLGSFTDMDDGFIGPFTFPLSIVGKTSHNCFININGIITWNNGFADYVPDGLETVTLPAVAAFWADVDLRQAGRVWYRFVDKDSYSWLPDFYTAQDVILGGEFHPQFEPTTHNNEILFAPDRGLIVTWDQVGYYDENGDLLDTFQLAIFQQDAPLRTYAFMTWPDIEWIMAEAYQEDVQEPARIGFTNGDTYHWYEAPLSGTEAVSKYEGKVAVMRLDSLRPAPEDSCRRKKCVNPVTKTQEDCCVGKPCAQTYDDDCCDPDRTYLPGYVEYILLADQWEAYSTHYSIPRYPIYFGTFDPETPDVSSFVPIRPVYGYSVEVPTNIPPEFYRYGVYVLFVYRNLGESITALVELTGLESSVMTFPNTVGESIPASMFSGEVEDYEDTSVAYVGLPDYAFNPSSHPRLTITPYSSGLEINMAVIWNIGVQDEYCCGPESELCGTDYFGFGAAGYCCAPGFHCLYDTEGDWEAGYGFCHPEREISTMVDFDAGSYFGGWAHYAGVYFAGYSVQQDLLEMFVVADHVNGDFDDLLGEDFVVPTRSGKWSFISSGGSTSGYQNVLMSGWTPTTDGLLDNYFRVESVWVYYQGTRTAQFEVAGWPATGVSFVYANPTIPPRTWTKVDLSSLGYLEELWITYYYTGADFEDGDFYNFFIDDVYLTSIPVEDYEK